MSRPDVLAALEAQRSKEAALKQTEVKDSVGTTGQAVPGKLAPKRMPGFEFDAVSNRWWPAGKAPKRAVVPIVPKAHISPPSSPSAMSTIARLYSRSVGTLTPSQFMHEAHHCTLRRLVPVLAGADEAGEPAVCVATSFDSRVFATVYSYRVDISSVIPVRGRVKWSLRTVPMEVSLPRAAVIVAAAFLDAATASGQYLLALGVSGVGTGPGLTLFLRFIVDDAGSVVPISSTYQHLVNVCVSSIAARDVCGPGGPLIAVGGAGTSNSPKLSSCFLRLGADVVLSRWSTRSDVFAVDCSAAHNNMVIAGCRNGEVCMVDCREPAKCVAITRLPSSVTFVRFLSGGNSVVLADTKDSMLLYDVRRWAAPMVKIPGYHNSYKRSPVAVDGHWCDTVVVACPHWPAPGVCACTSPISAWEAHTGTQLTTKAVDCEYVSSRITSLGLCRLINGAILAPFVTQSAGRGLFQLPR